MSEQAPPYDGEDVKAKTTTVSLYERDLRDIERIRRHFKLEGFSVTVRRAIRDVAEAIPDEKETVAA
jgi:hypothetical protein